MKILTKLALTIALLTTAVAARADLARLKSQKGWFDCDRSSRMAFLTNTG